MPIAYQLLSELVKGRALKEFVVEMLTETVLLREPYMKELIHSILRKLLVRRDNSSPDSNSNVGCTGGGASREAGLRRYEPIKKQKFSKLIQYIMDQESRESAVKLLEEGCNALPSNDDKAYIAQTLARMHYMDQKEISLAQKWAANASKLAPEKFAIVDTEGQVYKRLLK